MRHDCRWRPRDSQRNPAGASLFGKHAVNGVDRRLTRAAKLIRTDEVSASQYLEKARAEVAGRLHESAPEDVMLTIVVILLVLWFLGVVTTTTLGGLLHILLILAIVFLLIHVIQGRSISNL